MVLTCWNVWTQLEIGNYKRCCAVKNLGSRYFHKSPGPAEGCGNDGQS